MIELSVSMFDTLLLIRAHTITLVQTVNFLLSHNQNITDQTAVVTSIPGLKDSDW